MDQCEIAIPGLQNALEAEGLVLRCVRELHQDADAGEASNKMLSRLGRILGADRTYVFDIREGYIVNTYEWCAEGVEPEIDELRRIDLDVIGRWLDIFERGECVIIEDLSALSDASPLEYEVLAPQNVRSLAAAPLERDGRIVGFIGIDNPPAEKIRNIAAPLKTLGYFYLMTLERLANEERLRALSYRDELTGLHNRNRYIADLEERREGDSLGVIFLDVNDLKEVNDRLGHGRGDEMLRLCAEGMVESLPRAQVYRIGGDEFVALSHGCTREEFDAMAGRLRAAFDRMGAEHGLLVSVGSRWAERVENAHDLIAEADAEMYRKKRSFHLEKALSGVMPWGGEDLAGGGPRSRVPAMLHADRSGILGECDLILGVLGVGVAKCRLADEPSIVWANDRFFELAGRAREECLGRFGAVLEDVFADDPEELARLSRLVAKAREGDGRFDGLVRLPRRPGEARWVRVAGARTGERIDGALAACVTLADVTDLLEGRLDGSGRTAPAR